MKCIDLINEIKSWAVLPVNPEKTCDTVKCGDAQKEVKKVATTMFATPEVVCEAVKWGADLLIVHEPTFYNHMDMNQGIPIELEKRKFLDSTGLVVCRFHDYAHAMQPDLIYEGQMKYLDLKGKCVQSETVKGKYFAINNFILDEETTARDLAKLVQERLNIKHLRVAGSLDAKGRRISCCFGTPGHLREELAENDFVFTGEICEWELGEIARDYAQFGYNKAVFVMSHICSERCGMMLLADKLNEKFDVDARYIECGEVYQYVEV